MRRGLAPYAIASAAVVVISVVILGTALSAGGLLGQRTVVEPIPTAAGTLPPIELSRNGRLAYWRPDAGGGTLWVSGIDGGQRRALATIDLLSRVRSTRWSPDGNAVAYLDRAEGAVVLRLDGHRVDIPLSPAITAAGARLIDLEWSTDSRSIASTLGPGNGFGGSNIYVVSADGGQWRLVTSETNGFLSQWISADELLIHTEDGLIAVVRSDGTRLRPLTGLTATSPFLAEDGRVYFLAGQIVPTVRDRVVPFVNAAQARIWSVTLDGSDVRQEEIRQYDDIRLAGRWPDGRLLAHQGLSTSLVVLAPGQSPITVGGVIDRIAFSPDRRTAIGVNLTRIFRYDVTHPELPALLLSDVVLPDAWYPQPLPAVATQPSPATAGPKARYTFALHGVVWATDAAGRPQLVGRLQTDAASLRRLGGVAVPQWSPRGDRIVYFDLINNSYQGVVFVTDTTGNASRVGDQQDAAGPFPRWSPDGNIAFTQLIGTRDSASFGADSETRIVTTGNARIATNRGREIAFGGGKTYLIDNGVLSQSPQTRVDHSILEVLPGGATRTVATRAAVAPANRPGVFEGIPLQLSALGVSADGAYVSVRASPAAGNRGFVFSVMRAADGAATIVMDGQGVGDVRWSPSGHLVGLTLGGLPRVLDAETSVVVASAGDGRFAGWSPDGVWFYVARDVGLFAIPLKGGDAVRVSLLGVPVSTTTP